MMPCTHHIDELLQALPPISLEEMQAVRLMKRTDSKYVTNLATLVKLLELLKGNYYAQEKNGMRIAPYLTTYWDDARNGLLRMHQTGRKPRLKVRVRTYVDSDLSFLEVKRKDNHGKTQKKRVEVHSIDAVIHDHEGEAFLKERTGLDFTVLRPTVGNSFSRITLVNLQQTERLTIDFNLQFHNYLTEADMAMPHTVVIELKRDGRVASPVVPLLRMLRIKPSGFSKYCFGATLTNDAVRPNRLKKRIRRVRKLVLKGSAPSFSLTDND